MFEFISLAVHQVLYYRNLYPKDAFDWGHKYGFDCRLCKYEGRTDKRAVTVNNVGNKLIIFCCFLIVKWYKHILTVHIEYEYAYGSQPEKNPTFISLLTVIHQYLNDFFEEAKPKLLSGSLKSIQLEIFDDKDETEEEVFIVWMDLNDKLVNL